MKLVYCVLEIARELALFSMVTSRILSIAQTGLNFENFNFFVVFRAYTVQKSIMRETDKFQSHLYTSFDT
jgi:hypothetical protein